MSDKIQELKMNELKDMFFYTFGIVPLQNYGVIGDGMTDNRLKLQQAIYDAIEVKAKYIFVPKGNYYYSQELFRANEVAFIGNSIDAYIKGVEIKQFPGFNEQEISNQDIYLTEEQPIGTWIDGKTIYQKIIEFSALNSNATSTIIHNIENLNKIVSISGAFIREDGNLEILPRFDVATSWSVIIGDINNTSISIIVGSSYSGSCSISSGHLIIKYTKTTD